MSENENGPDDEQRQATAAFLKGVEDPLANMVRADAGNLLIHLRRHPNVRAHWLVWLVQDPDRIWEHTEGAARQVYERSCPAPSGPTRVMLIAARHPDGRLWLVTAFVPRKADFWDRVVGRRLYIRE